MSRYDYDSANPPSRPSEAVDAMVLLLVATVAIMQQLGGKNVYAHEAPADKPASGKWMVVRERTSLGGERETTSGLITPVIQVMTETRQSLQTPAAARAWHGTVQGLAAGALMVQTLSVITGEAKLVRRVNRPSPARYDADDKTRYSTSAFSVTMGPNP